MRGSARKNGLPLSIARPAAGLVALLASLLLLVAPHFDVHRAQQAEVRFGGDRPLIAEAASHPDAPLHVESSPQREEEPCAFCLFSGQIGSGLLGAPAPQPHLDAQDAERLAVAPPSAASPRSGLSSRAPPAA